MTLDSLASTIHTTAVGKGFWSHDEIVVCDPLLGDVEARIKNPSIDAEKIALMHSELSEALEALRDEDMEHVEEELADTIIRILDYAEARQLSMDRAIRDKMRTNDLRPHMHGRKM